MANTVRSPVDTILGEAVHGTREQRYADMLGIASVIDNRTRLTGQTPQSVIAAPRQFDAYGKSLPKGAEAYRGLAQQAWDHVQTVGPVHTGTYYATPDAVKNLPPGLEPVAQTTGHVYHVDPQARPIATVKGFVKPTVEAVTAVANRVADAAQAVASGAVNVAGGAVNAVANGLGLPSVAPAPASRPRGLAALAPNGLAFARPEQSTISPALRDALTGLSAEFGQPIGVNSGYRSPSYNASIPGAAKNSLHTKGLAADIDMTGWSDGKRQQAIQELTQRGVTGFIGYSQSPNMMHVDMRSRPPGASPHFMFDKTAANMPRAPGYFQEMAKFGGLKTPDVAPVPDARPGQTYAAPLGQVTRGPALAPAFDNPAQAAQAQKTSQAYQQAAQTMAPVGVTGVGATPAPAPSDSKLAGAYGQLASTLGIAGLNGLGAMPATPMTAPVPTAAPRTAPLPAPVAVTQPPAPPLPAPKVVQSYPVAPAPSFPSAPPAPVGPSVSDIYGGVIGSALSPSGNTVSRDRFGNTSVTNKYGATTVTTPGGYQAATSIGAPASQGTQSMGGGLGSLLSPPSTQLGGMVRSTAGGLAGSMLGGMLGPVGSIVGGIIGREMAMGRNPLGIFSGQTVGRNSFPSAPAGPRTGANFSNRSDRAMRDISPAAADAIGKGQGGLY